MALDPIKDFKHVALINVHNIASAFASEFQGLGLGPITPHPTAERITFHQFSGPPSPEAELAWFMALHKKLRLSAVVGFYDKGRLNEDVLAVIAGIKTATDIPVILIASNDLDKVVRDGLLETPVDPITLNRELHGFNYVAQRGQGDKNLTILPWNEEKEKMSFPATLHRHLDYVSNLHTPDLLKKVLGIAADYRDESLNRDRLREVGKQLEKDMPEVNPGTFFRKSKRRAPDRTRKVAR